MKLKFWGVRGSVPCPGSDTVKYGGNTACLEIRLKDTGKLIIVDAGSGIRELGNFLMVNDFKDGPINADVFLTHTHWDHIMGFPFFTPIYIPGTKLHIYGPVTFENQTLESIVSGQLTYRYFPVRQEELAAKIEYFDLKEEKISLEGNLRIITKYLNHPVLCLGYRFEYNGKALCTCYDTEPFQNVFCTDENDPSYNKEMAMEGERVADDENSRIEKFIYGADLVIYDAQYTDKEYLTNRKGWGHTSIENAIKAGKKSKVKRLILFHHEPVRTDAELDELEKIYCEPECSKDFRVEFAREGVEIEL